MKLIFRLAFTCLIICSFASCGAIVKGSAVKRTTYANNAIPPNFAENPGTLVCVLQGRNSRDKYMKKHVEKIYKGDYIFVHKDSLNNSAYSNKDKYRYLFDYNSTTSVQVMPDPNTGMFRQSNIRSSTYYIKDRKTGAAYSNDLNSGYFSKLIQGYVIGLEAARAGDFD